MMGAKVLQWALEIPKAFQYSQYPGVENISILNLDDFRDGASTIQGVMAGEGHCTQWGLHDFMVATLANFCAFLKGCAGQFLPCAKTVGSIIRDIEVFQGAFASTRIELKRALQIRKDIIGKLNVLSDEIFEYECSAPQEPSRAKPPQDKIAQELLNFGMEMGKRHPEMKNPEIIRWICNKENGKLAWAARIILDNAKAGEDVMMKAQVQRDWEKLVLERTFKKKIRKWAQYLSQYKNGKGRTEKRE